MSKSSGAQGGNGGITEELASVGILSQALLSHSPAAGLVKTHKGDVSPGVKFGQPGLWPWYHRPTTGRFFWKIRGKR
jgi:hypothetical protein